MSSSYRSQAYQARRAPEPRRSTAGWLAVIVFAFLAGVGIITAFAVGAGTLGSALMDALSFLGPTGLAAVRVCAVCARRGATSADAIPPPAITKRPTTTAR